MYEYTIHETTKIELFQCRKRKECLYANSLLKLITIENLSFEVPAYNEEERLPVMLNEALGFLEERKRATPSYTYEIIIVDDGSKDTTTETGLIYSDKYGTDKGWFGANI